MTRKPDTATETGQDGKSIEFDKLLNEIIGAHELLSTDEFVELYNGIFPANPIVYMGDDYFERKT